MYKDFELLKKECLKCNKCELSKERHNIVFGEGNEKAEVMFIGEGPGKNEDLQGIPFIGRAGILLDKMLDAVDLSREKNIYIANMVKCRPPMNRDPLPCEQEACMPWLLNQIEIINPKIVVCVGRIAAMKFINPNFKITREHGIFTEIDGRLFMATLHPAALLRNPNQKPAAFEDFLKLREKIKEICTHTY